MNGSTRRHLRIGLVVLATFTVLRPRKITLAADGYTPFTDEKTAWHEGFDRCDFVMDDAAGAITPVKAPDREITSFGIDVALANSKRRCVLIVPG